MDGRPFIDATTIGVLVALLVVVASILASHRKPVAPPLPRGDGIIVLECVQLEEHSRTAAAAAASTRWIRCHESFGANIKAVRSIPKASADATYGAILLIEPLRQFEALAFGILRTALMLAPKLSWQRIQRVDAAAAAAVRECSSSWTHSSTMMPSPRGSGGATGLRRDARIDATTTRSATNTLIVVASMKGRPSIVYGALLQAAPRQ